jgi:DNA-binding NtrC family response regulator
LSGAKLMDEVRRMHPHMPILVCSAYGANDAVRERVARGDVLLLTKSFTRKDLLGAVERALALRGAREPEKPVIAGVSPWAKPPGQRGP